MIGHNQTAAAAYVYQGLLNQGKTCPRTCNPNSRGRFCNVYLAVNHIRLLLTRVEMNPINIFQILFFIGRLLCHFDEIKRMTSSTAKDLGGRDQTRCFGSEKNNNSNMVIRCMLNESNRLPMISFFGTPLSSSSSSSRGVKSVRSY